MAGQKLTIDPDAGTFPTYTWKVPAGTGTYEVAESGADVDGYDRTTEGLDSVTVAAPQDFVTGMTHETTCSHVNWSVNENDATGFMFYGMLTGGRGDGIVVISQYALSASQQAAAKAYIKANAHDGQEKKDPVRFFSVQTNGNTFDINGAQITYRPSEGKVYFDATSTWTHCGSLSYSTSKRQDADIKISNDYKPQTTSVSATKVWDDNNNQDGKRSDVTLHLVAKAGDATLTAAQLGIDSLDKTIAASATGDALIVTWTNLPKYQDGAEVAYTVTEPSAPAGYTSAVTGDAAAGFTVTNAHTPEKTQVSVAKNWDDAEYVGKDGYSRPSSVTVQLYANGAASGDPVTLSDSNSWCHTWGDLDKYSNGTEIAYTVEETPVPDGYASKVSGSASAGYTVTNTPAGKRDVVTPISLTVHKTDANTGNPLAGATFTIEGMGSVTTNAYGNATFTFKQPGTYTMTETAPEGYVANPGSWTIEVSKSGVDKVQYNKSENVWEWFYHLFFPEGADYAKGTLTVSNQPEKVNIPVTKVWNDSNNQDGKRPQSITVRLLADGTEVDSKTVTEADNWACSFSNLPKYKDGKKITYTVTEDAVAGYTTAISGTTITNTHTPETTQASATKVWEDNNNQDGKRPASVQVQLFANGAAYGEPVTLSEDNEWQWAWTNLPKYQNGAEVAYTVTELSTPTGYTSNVSGDAATGFTVTNTHTPETVDVSGSKTWNDAKYDGKTGYVRPESITINLLKNGEQVKSATVTAADDWSFKFTGLPKYENGQEITYTVTETTPDGYTSTVDGFSVTNTPKEGETVNPTSITIKKVDGASESHAALVGATFTLTDPDGNASTYTTGQDGTATVTFSKEGTYTLVETAAPTGYTKSDKTYQIKVTKEFVRVELQQSVWQWIYSLVTGSDSVEFANGVLTVPDQPEKVNIPVTKLWNDSNNQDGKRPESVQVQLLANYQPSGDPVALNAANEWKHTWTDLPGYVDGAKVTYTVAELGADALPAGYTSAVSGDAAKGFTVTNSYTPETTTISGSKTWDDANNQDGKRPASITVNLLANGQKVDSTTATAAGNWAYSFADVPVYKNGQKITYTVTEDAVAGYTTTISGTTITNTHVPETVDVSGAKTWDDANDQDGLRPDSITVRLLADGAEVDSKAVTEADNWAWSFGRQGHQLHCHRGRHRRLHHGYRRHCHHQRPRTGQDQRQGDQDLERRGRPGRQAPCQRAGAASRERPALR